MDITTCNWNAKTYKIFQKELYQLQDLKYREFHGKLIQNMNSLIGIRTPILKEIAKKIAHNQPEEFLKYVQHDTYEETLIHGLLLGYIKIEFKDLINYLDDFFPYMNNWALNDITCANLKLWKKHLKEGILVILSYLKNENPWVKRFGLVLLLDYYVNDEYIDFILDTVSSISGVEYYVGMANAWLISICYIYYPEKTYSLLKKKILDNFTQNHAIQKIIESTRVSKKEKEIIRKLRHI